MTKRQNRPSSPDEEARQSAPTPETEIKWGGFIDVRMTDVDKQQFSSWCEEVGADIWEQFADLLALPLKFGLTWDAENNTYIATFTGTPIPNHPFRYCLTARAGGWEKAIYLLIYKHSVMLKANWGNYRPRTGYAVAEI